MHTSAPAPAKHGRRSGILTFVPGYSISIFLPDGAPTGLRIARRSHWTGEVLMCPRTLYPAISERSEFGRTGAYVLVGESDDAPDGNRVYVGESDVVRNRIKSHELTKDFWDSILVVTKTDGSLHKADVRYLEAKLIELAKKSPTTTIENNTNPAPPEPVESHKADLDSFLADTLAIFRLLGIDAFSVESSKAKSVNAPPPAQPSVPESPITATGEYYFSAGKAHGRMTVNQDGYTLHPGDGVARADKPSLSGTLKALRKKLLENGTMQEVPDAPENLRLTTELSFKSPSAAACVLYAGSINGRGQWKDSDGNSLAEREAAAVAAIPKD